MKASKVLHHLDKRYCQSCLQISLIPSKITFEEAKIIFLASQRILTAAYCRSMIQY